MKLNIVPARTGIQWVKLGVLTFFRQPLALAGLFFMYTAVVVLLAQIPVIGVVIGGVLVTLRVSRKLPCSTFYLNPSPSRLIFFRPTICIPPQKPNRSSSIISGRCCRPC